MDEVEVPVEVAQALDHYQSKWKNMTNDDVHLMLLTIPNVPVTGPAATIKNFARKHPATYIKALANGYVAKKDITELTIHLDGKELANFVWKQL